MWGEVQNVTLQEGRTTNCSINLYRAVSKINVTVNEGKGLKNGDKDLFKLQSVRVCYARKGGLAGSLITPDTEGEQAISYPSIPEGITCFSRDEIDKLYFETAKGGAYALDGRIYVPESEQKASTSENEPMCLIIGGYYNDSQEETFYRVDFKPGNKGNTFYHAVRNHIYTFNITDVTRPGTDAPDPALDHTVVGMDVTIKDWTTTWIQGIGGQYTLEVSTGGFVFASTNISENLLKVNSTNNEGWRIENPNGSWFKLTQSPEGVIIIPEENTGGERYGTFIIKSGNLEKVITVRQKGKGTANCYIVSDDGNHIEQDLIVTVKGSGEVGLVADGVTLEEKDPYISINEIGDVQIIWETSDGLIQIVKDTLNDINKAKLYTESGIIKYKVYLENQNKDIIESNRINSQSYKGGNALVGAFGKKGDGSVDYNNLLWSWHIWVCPDIDKDNNGIISETELNSTNEEWITGYTFMDRNMGALSNEPGLASLGLLYQWGRKDPFIGAARVSKDRTNNRMYTHLPLEDYGYYWRNSQGDMDIKSTIQAPTTLINGQIKGADFNNLWGTASGLEGESNAGNKTIYDPCPLGYRVPNVAAVIFKGVGHAVNIRNSNSENDNWYSNNQFWPLEIAKTSGGWEYYNYIRDCSSYGFWLRYDTHSTEPSIEQYSSSFNTNKQERNPQKPMTWLPLSGVYEGDINQLATLNGQSSLQSNSIMWTNSSVSFSSGGKTITRPAGLFLHGVKNARSDYDGNHFHKLKESGSDGALYAKPEHAGALRCVRDTKVNIPEESAIKLPETIYLAGEVGDMQTAEITSLSGSWEVIDPGAMWFVMTPDAGPVGSKQRLTFKSTQENTGDSRTAYIKIRINDEKGTIGTIKVIQESSVETEELFFNYRNNSQKGVSTGQNNWNYAIEYQEGNNWLNIRSSGSMMYINTATNNNNSAKRHATITIKNSSTGTRIKIIKVTQYGR